MIRVCFQNGPDGPEIVLSDEYETEAEAKDQLERLARIYGTVEGAAAWVEGTKKPKGLDVEPDVEAIPADSVLKEHVIKAPPSPEAEAAELEKAAKAREKEAAANEAAIAENEAAHAAIAEEKAAEEKKAEAKAAKDKK